jgi:hypothetical protein
MALGRRSTTGARWRYGARHESATCAVDCVLPSVARAAGGFEPGTVPPTRAAGGFARGSVPRSPRKRGPSRWTTLRRDGCEPLSVAKLDAGAGHQLRNRASLRERVRPTRGKAPGTYPPCGRVGGAVPGSKPPAARATNGNAQPTARSWWFRAWLRTANAELTATQLADPLYGARAICLTPPARNARRGRGTNFSGTVQPARQSKYASARLKHTRPSRSSPIQRCS